jgi:hypothetical protein
VHAHVVADAGDLEGRPALERAVEAGADLGRATAAISVTSSRICCAPSESSRLAIS